MKPKALWDAVLGIGVEVVYAAAIMAAAYGICLLFSLTR
jgi:hypothetical protein